MQFTKLPLVKTLFFSLFERENVSDQIFDHILDYRNLKKIFSNLRENSEEEMSGGGLAIDEGGRLGLKCRFSWRGWGWAGLEMTSCVK